MNLRYGDLIQLVERLHTLPASRGGATESRIKNFSRLGFPPGPRVGTGERAEYGVAQTIQLIFAFELLRHRMPPAVIAEIVRTEWTRIAAAFAEAASAILDDRVDRSSAAPILLVDSLALHEIGKTIRPGELLSTVEPMTVADLATAFSSGGPFGRSALVISPMAILADLVAQLPVLRRPKDARSLLAGAAELAGDRVAAADRQQRSGSGRA